MLFKNFLRRQNIVVLRLDWVGYMKPAILTVSSTTQERGANKIHIEYVDRLKGLYSEVFPILKSVEAIRNVAKKLEGYPLVYVVVAAGGTSDLILEIAKHTNTVLLTHGKQNSLASALNAAFRLKRKEKYVKIVHGLSSSSFEEIKCTSLISEVVSQLKGKRIILFCASKEWAERTYGVSFLEEKLKTKVIPVDIEEFIEKFEKSKENEELIKKYGSFPRKEVVKEDIVKASRILTVMQDELKKNYADLCAFRCFPFLTREKITPCLAISHLLDLGITAACEGDLSSMLMLKILHLLSGKPAFMGNVEDFQDNLLTLAHCTVASTMVLECTIRSHFETGYGVSIAGVFEKNREVTIANFSPDFKELFFTRGLIVDGYPVSEEFCRTQVKLRVNKPVNYIIEKSVNRHLCFVAGNFEKELEKLAEFLQTEIL